MCLQIFQLSGEIQILTLIDIPEKNTEKNKLQSSILFLEILMDYLINKAFI